LRKEARLALINMGTSDSFLPKFEISGSLGSDLRNIKIAKELTTGCIKVNFIITWKMQD